MKHIKKYKSYIIKEDNFNSSDETETELRAVKVTYSDGTVIPTNMAANLSDDDIRNYFKIGRTFNIGEGEKDNLQKVVKVEIIK